MTAIETVNGDVSAAGRRFALRMQANAAKFTAAATGFAGTETDSASALDSVQVT